ncbi:Dyp-type peroxidase [Streptomyces sp. NPDC015242]|uniref:Dyp-type peroxidase n=1 Tax=Streptomyces sp. NPDC015242 TaxID=3364951 RepID=UPI0036FD547E
MTSPLPPHETLSQPLLNPPASVAVFLVATIEPGGEPAVREVLGSLAGLVRSVGFPSPDGGLGCVAGIGSRAWARVIGGPRPAELHPFRELAGPRHHAPATPGDLFFHLRAARTDLCFALAAELVRRLRGAVTVRDETQAFSTFDARNLLGFVDGTENPVGRAAADAALVGDEDPGFRGGAYAIVQKYLHDVDAWDALAVEAQEKIIGRTKLTNLELDAPGSHKDVNTVLGPDGSEQKILRSAMPFGRPGHGEFGTYFVAYARTPEIPETMLRKMYLGGPGAGPDPLLDYARAVTGNLFFVPPAAVLDALPDS